MGIIGIATNLLRVEEDVVVEDRTSHVEVMSDFRILADLEQLVAGESAGTANWELSPGQVSAHHGTDQVGFRGHDLEVGLGSPHKTTF